MNPPVLDRREVPTMTEPSPLLHLSQAEKVRAQRLLDEGKVVRARVEELRPQIAELPEGIKQLVHEYVDAAERYREITAERLTLKRLVGDIKELEDTLKEVRRERERWRRRAEERWQELNALQPPQEPPPEFTDPDLDRLVEDILRDEGGFEEIRRRHEELSKELDFLDEFETFQRRPVMQLLLIAMEYRPDLLEKMRKRALRTPVNADEPGVPQPRAVRRVRTKSQE